MAGSVIEVNDGNFQAQVVDSNIPTVVDFWAAWCGPCRAIAPLLGELADEFQGKVQVVKLNVDYNPKTASTYGVRSLPTLLLIKNGEVVGTHVGSAPKKKLKSFLEQAL